MERWPQHVVVMGVSGSGKSTLARELARRWGRAFCEGDDLHLQESRDAMAAGIPLTEEQRSPWLGFLRDWMVAAAERGERTVVTCSALRRGYRDVLREAGEVFFLHVAPPVHLIRERLERRTGHFMRASLLGSQLDLLEPLEADEPGCTLVSAAPPRQLVDEVEGLPVHRDRPRD